MTRDRGSLSSVAITKMPIVWPVRLSANADAALDDMVFKTFERDRIPSGTGYV